MALGFSQEKTGNPLEASGTYASMLPFLASIPALGALSSEFRLWTERLLCRMTAVATSSSPGERMELDRMLQMFHLWTSLSRLTPANLKVPYQPPTQTQSLVELGPEVEYSRWDMWMAYYRTLSYILQKGFIYAPSYTESNPKVLHSRLGIADGEFLKVRLQQRAELKRVEASIETKLLDETRFPKANERNERIERWVDAIMANWRVMCGPTWQDDELGEGGKNAIARGVLDVSCSRQMGYGIC
jgi:cargo-transport protein YPP1